MVSENPPADQPALQSAPSPFAFQGARGFLMVGAAIVVAGHLLFGLLIGEFTYGTTNVAVALLILMSVLGKGLGVGGTGIQRILGYFLGLSGLVALLSDIRFGFPNGIVDNIANVLFYGGTALAFLGALAVKD